MKLALDREALQKFAQEVIEQSKNWSPEQKEIARQVLNQAPDASKPLRERVAELEAENQKLAEEIHEINERLRPIAILVKSVAEEKTRLERSMQKIKNCFISKKRLYTTPSKTLELIEAFVNDALKESDHA